MSDFIERIKHLKVHLGTLLRPVPEPEYAVFAKGYMGDPEAWCYWDVQYGDEGSVGPFGTREEAVAHAHTSGAFEP